MPWLKPVRNLRIGPRLAGGFLVVMVLFVATGLIALSGLTATSRAYNEALQQFRARALVGTQLKAAVLEEVRAQKNYLLRGDPIYLEMVERQEAGLGELRAKLEAAALEAEDKELLDELDDTLGVLQDTFRENIGLREKLGIEAADDLLRGKAEDVIKVLDAIIARAQAAADRQEASALAETRNTQRITMVSIVLIGLVALLLSLVLGLSVTQPLKLLRKQINAIAAGEPVPDAPAVEGSDEVAQIAGAFYELVQKAALLREMEARSRWLEALSSRVSRAQEEERGRIARELHDGLGQVLTAIKLNIGAANRSLGENEDTRERLERIRRLADESLDELRRLVFDLHPPALDNLGLAAALESFARNFKEHTQVNIAVEADEIEPRLAREVEIALYRICQEALTNVAKHSKATDAVVRLKEEAQSISLTVWDNGAGFDMDAVMHSESPPKGIGLLSIERRVEELKGRYRITSSREQGTTVSITVPRTHEKNDDENT